MNDMKVTEKADGAIELKVQNRPGLMLWPAEVAAFREYFAAEHDAALVAEREQGVKVILTMDEAVKVKAAMESVERLGAERDAAGEQLAAAETVIREALDVMRSPFRDDGTPLAQVRENTEAAQAILAAYPVSSAPQPTPGIAVSINGRTTIIGHEQPTPLDPEPWTDGTEARSPYRSGSWDVFDPRPEFEQDRARYLEPKDGAS